MCQLCTPGQYCAETGLSSPSGPCSPGYYCIQGSHTSTPQDNNNTGHYLQLLQCLIVVMNLKALQRYLVEFVSDGEESAARKVEDFYSQIRFIGDVCPAGHYCPIGSARPEPCPPGRTLTKSSPKNENSHIINSHSCHLRPV